MPVTVIRPKTPFFLTVSLTSLNRKASLTDRAKAIEVDLRYVKAIVPSSHVPSLDKLREGESSIAPISQRAVPCLFPLSHINNKVRMGLGPFARRQEEEGLKGYLRVSQLWPTVSPACRSSDHRGIRRKNRNFRPEQILSGPLEGGIAER